MDEKIIELRKAGLGYKAIAGEVGVKRDKVRYVCLKHGLGGTIASNSPEEREKRFKKAFEEKFPEFEYHSGFVNTDSKFKCKCKTCGTIAVKNAQCARPSREKRLRCDKCTLLERKAYLQLTEEERRKQRAEREKRDLAKAIARWEARRESCLECREQAHPRSMKEGYCSKCYKRIKNRKEEIRRRKKLRANGKVNYDITLDKIIKRDKSVCRLCGEPVDIKDCKTTKQGHFIAGGNYPSIDHIIPVSRGGTHTWNNVQLAHRHCNSVKSDK